MSRIVVKGLPKYVTDAELRAHFAAAPAGANSANGGSAITDLCVLRTPTGVSRQMAFIGYRTEADAQAAIQYFHRTYLDASRLTVERAEAERQARRAARGPGGPGLAPGEVDGGPARAAAAAAAAPAPPPAPATSTVSPEEAKQRKAAFMMSIFGDAVPPEAATKLADPPTSSTSLSTPAPATGSTPAPATGSTPAPADPAAPQGDLSDMDYLRSKMVAASAFEDAAAPEASAEERPLDMILDTGRLFVKNIPYTATEDELEALFAPFGKVSEVHLIMDSERAHPGSVRVATRNRGYAFVAYMLPEHAVRAYSTLQGAFFQGRILSLAPAAEKPHAHAVEDEADDPTRKGTSAFKREKEKRDRLNATTATFSWNAFFINHNAAMDAVAAKLNISKRDVLDAAEGGMAVRAALAETDVLNDTRRYLEDHGVNLYPRAAGRSKTTILVKNLPFMTTQLSDLRAKFTAFGDVSRIIFPPATKALAIVEFVLAQDARRAFARLAFSKMGNLPMYLEWAPVDVWEPPSDGAPSSADAGAAATKEASAQDDSVGDAKKEALEALEAAPEAEPEACATLFVSNLSFSTRDNDLHDAFSVIPGLRSARVVMRHAPTKPAKPGAPLPPQQSMGFGFVEFATKEDAVAAMKQLQGTRLQGHALVLKFNMDDDDASPSARLLIKNLPFQASRNELRRLFAAYGAVKSVRVPQQFDGRARGFAFVEYMTKREAGAARKTLSETHFYGRRMVIEFAKEGESVEAVRERTKRAYVADGDASRNKRTKVVLGGES
ncbi:hypothetical protein CXG81DRAFT_14842 [Caulochytrium protostelioides]|uniref:RRM domain-containing protein n=1 Tax=Caulochytrium protostelioides TaxID=1555241 RepID=A0A4V1IU37_9FUNG|nr:hypothetical protein CXG81DRAFT_14842 [Caulochytrium protostelioides]|eukprot:RKO99197.1 hypothetical protein CXG81DRAFT_14842 [Caulochytrium protostelioides]